MLLTVLDFISICVYSISGISGTIGNIVLLAAIKYRSPASWKFVPFKDVTTSVYLGPCTLFSGFICHILHSIMSHTMTQSFFFIAISFCYRLYVINRPGPSRAKMALFCIAVYLPTLPVLILILYTNDPPDEVRAALKHFHPDHDQFEGYVIEGHVDLRIRWTSVLIHIFLFPLILPMCLIVFFILKGLTANAHIMTTKTKAMHTILVKVLTLQALLPILFFCSVICLMLVKRQIYDAPIIEYAIFWNISYMPALAPIITIYNITPFREFVLRRERRSLSATTKSKNSITNIASQ